MKPMRLPTHIVQSIKLMNSNDPKKWNWLVSQVGTDKVLSQDQETGEIKYPVPSIFGGENVVGVVSVTGMWAKVVTHPITKRIPLKFPVYLRHLCFGYTKSHQLFLPAGGVYMPVLFTGRYAYTHIEGLDM
jgi:hypothetical protein